MKKRVIRLLVLCFVIGMIISMQSMVFAKEKVVKLKIGHVCQESTVLHQACLVFAKNLEKYSNGTIKAEIFPNSSLGSNREGVEQLQMGITDGWVISNGAIAPFTKSLQVYDLPYLWKSKEAGLAFFNSEFGIDLLKPLEKVGLKGLGYYTQGWRHLTYNSDKPIRKPEDLKGLKIRTMNSPIHIDTWKVLGASPGPMAFSEVFSSLQQGVIDGEENPLENIKFMGFNQVQKYITLDGHVLDPVEFILSKKTWDSFTIEQQEVVQKAVTDSCLWDQKYVFEACKKIREDIEKNDNSTEIIILSKEQRKAFREAAQPVYDKYRDQIGADLIKKVEDFQSNFEEVVPQS